MLTAYIDGSCKPTNPGGTAAYGIIIFKAKENSTEIIKEPKGTIVWQNSETIGSGPEMSNNVAEYYALLQLLLWLDSKPVEDISILSDSQLVVNQITGNWKVKKGLYKPYLDCCLRLMVQNQTMWKDKIKFKWIPREENLAHLVIEQRIKIKEEEDDNKN